MTSWYVSWYISDNNFCTVPVYLHPSASFLQFDKVLDKVLVRFRQAESLFYKRKVYLEVLNLLWVCSLIYYLILYIIFFFIFYHMQYSVFIAECQSCSSFCTSTLSGRMKFVDTSLEITWLYSHHQLNFDDIEECFVLDIGVLSFILRHIYI
jgi:hypothetical protein